ncbi:hypothetical protein MKEN_00270500 [Mycena kentingensis (nom. inval.)]|nr:hypothetical protein MKEN_00270500 [Mycena kentingensis (nom. inval.)]
MGRKTSFSAYDDIPPLIPAGALPSVYHPPFSMAIGLATSLARDWSQQGPKTATSASQGLLSAVLANVFNMDTAVGLTVASDGDATRRKLFYVCVCIARRQGAAAWAEDMDGDTN